MIVNILLILYLLYTVILLSLTTRDPTVGQTQDIGIVAEFPAEHPPENIAITPQRRLIMSQHQFYSAPLRIVEVMNDGSVTAFRGSLI